VWGRVENRLAESGLNWCCWWGCDGVAGSALIPSGKMRSSSIFGHNAKFNCRKGKDQNGSSFIHFSFARRFKALYGPTRRFKGTCLQSLERWGVKALDDITIANDITMTQW
jgi:hypothetical protein